MKSKVFIIKAEERSAGIRDLLDRFGLGGFRGRTVALKANYNSSDPFPASTHIETLGALIRGLKEAGSGSITLAERSGMGRTRTVLEQRGVFDLAKRLGFGVVVLDEEPPERWEKVEKGETHWMKGFYISKVFTAAERVVQTCCLKAHRFGGHFTMSLKNSVGLIAKRVPGGLYNYMWELHASPYQRLKIAEINKFYRTDLILMDAMKAFVDMGPEQGNTVKPGLLLAGSDRVAVDAVGAAILRSYGTTKEISHGRIFDLEQIRRAAELGVGVGSASEVELVPLNEFEGLSSLEEALEAG